MTSFSDLFMSIRSRNDHFIYSKGKTESADRQLHMFWITHCDLYLYRNIISPI